MNYLIGFGIITLLLWIYFIYSLMVKNDFQEIKNGFYDRLKTAYTHSPLRIFWKLPIFIVIYILGIYMYIVYKIASYTYKILEFIFIRKERDEKHSRNSKKRYSTSKKK